MPTEGGNHCADCTAKTCARMEGCAPTAGLRRHIVLQALASAELLPVRSTARTERRRNHCSDCGGASVCRACADNPRAVTKSKKLEVHQALRDAQIAFKYQHHLPFRGCGLELETAHTFADFAVPTPWGYVLVEVAEEQHKAYDPSCNVRRDFDMAASVALGSGHKLLVLRYNPDAFKIAGMTRQTSKKKYHAQLIRLLGGLLAHKAVFWETGAILCWARERARIEAVGQAIKQGWASQY